MPKNHTPGLLFALACLQLAPAVLPAAQRNRIVSPIDNLKRVSLRGHVHPRAIAGNDRGRVSATLQLPYVTVTLKQTAAQQADLEQLLAQQQDPSSPNYHRWLTPEEYADRFGVSQDDLNQVVAWLEQQNLHVAAAARARNWVAISGAARDVEIAFGIEIHHYQVDGVTHFANATDPSIPAALDTVVGDIRGLTDFRMRPAAKKSHQIAAQDLQALYNSSKGNHYLAPDDVATIYNVQPLFNQGIDGSGQKIVVVGQTQIKLTDIQSFRATFGLPANDPQVVLVPNTQDPGIVNGDMAEADLDIELAGGVARKATVIYVYSDDVEVSAQYAVDQNLAPVLSMSYGLCESLTASSDAHAQQLLARQANAQGITWIAASGDSGAADCVASSTRTSFGLNVDMPSSLPEVTGIGGTTFAEGSGNFWSSTNGANFGTALSYIPETSWNDSVVDGSPSATGGGASAFFTKPSWQVGLNVPSDGARDVPDVSLSGSADHDAYLFYSGGSLGGVGGTSVGAPSFAGMIALLNQYLIKQGVQTTAGLGNINPRLYALAQTLPSVYHDITSGDNMVDPCPSRARSCTSSSVGFAAGTGYDQATGLGSVDTYNMVTSWNAGGNAARSTANLVLASDSGAITSAGTTILTATVKSSTGITPSGTVTFSLGNTTLGTSSLSGSGGTATATISVKGSQLTLGPNSINALYSGDGSFSGATASATVTVSAASSGPPSISGLTNGASFQQVYAPGMVLSVFGSNLSPASTAAASVPLPASLSGVSATVNGVNAPLYYVSTGQLNIQVPYETPVGTNAVLQITNNGQATSSNFRLAAAAPGIFVNTAGAPVPNTSATRGQTVSLYITGEGAVTPSLATGASPAAGTALANLPKPTQSVSVTVGGVPAQVQFIGITSGLVGVTQINYQVPSNAPVGKQPVVVNVGGVASSAATLSVN